RGEHLVLVFSSPSGWPGIRRVRSSVASCYSHCACPLTACWSGFHGCMDRNCRESERRGVPGVLFARLVLLWSTSRVDRRGSLEFSEAAVFNSRASFSGHHRRSPDLMPVSHEVFT